MHTLAHSLKRCGNAGTLMLCMGVFAVSLTSVDARGGAVQPTQTGESTRTQSKHFLIGLGNVIEQLRNGTRGRPANQQTALTGQARGGAASAESSGITGFSRMSTIVIEDYAESERENTQRGRGYNQHTYTTTLGFDYRVNESLFAGATASYLSGKTDIDANAASQDLEIYVVGFHGSKYWQNALFLDWLMSYGSLGLDLERFDGAGNFEADTDGEQWSADLSLGYQYSSSRWRLTPVLKAFHLRGETDSYRETRLDGSRAPKVVDSQNFDSAVAELSVQSEYVVPANWGVVIPSINLAYQHEFSDADKSTGRNSGAGSSAASSFAETPDDPDDGTLTARVGISAQFQRGWSAFASYEHLLEHDYVDEYNVTVGVRYEIPEAYRLPHPKLGPRR